MNTTIQIARKQYKCQHCGGFIEIGQEYYKRIEGGKVHNRMTYYPITWHYHKTDCQPHYHKDNCTEECKVKDGE